MCKVECNNNTKPKSQNIQNQSYIIEMFRTSTYSCPRIGWAPENSPNLIP